MTSNAARGVTGWVLKEVFQQLYYAGVALEGMILKPNMIVPGKKCAKQNSVRRSRRAHRQGAEALRAAAVPGIAFLSGGQSDEDATAHLSAMNAIGELPWPLTFSYGRALQAAPQKAWSGKPENVAAGQAAFAHRALMNCLAALGKWTSRRTRRRRLELTLCRLYSSDLAAASDLRLPPLLISRRSAA